MDAGERALLAQTVRNAIEGSAIEGSAPALDAALTDLGWRDLLAAEPDDAVDILFTALGATNGSATVLDDVIAAALGVLPCAELAVLLPPFGTWAAPGHAGRDHAHDLGLATARAVTADEILVVSDVGDALRLYTVPASIAEVTSAPGIDPDAGLQRVHFDRAVPASAGTPLEAAAWPAAVALAQRAVAHQIAGASRAMLDLARAHAVERVQFGRPIAQFQAVRHRLAEALVAIEALESTLVAARDEPVPETAALAKAVAGRTARTVGGHCQQVLAGIGFTTDHPFHRYLKRTIVLDGLFGTADELVLHLGRGLLEARQVPTLIEL